MREQSFDHLPIPSPWENKEVIVHLQLPDKSATHVFTIPKKGTLVHLRNRIQSEQGLPERLYKVVIAGKEWKDEALSSLLSGKSNELIVTMVLQPGAEVEEIAKISRERLSHFSLLVCNQLLKMVPEVLPLER